MPGGCGAAGQRGKVLRQGVAAERCGKAEDARFGSECRARSGGFAKHRGFSAGVRAQAEFRRVESEEKAIFFLWSPSEGFREMKHRL